MANSLNLVGDGDDLDIVQRLEEMFEIAFSKEELEALTRVGDLHDLVLQKIPRENDAGKCASAMAFYRLRGALKVRQAGDTISPTTEMKIFNTPAPKLLFRDLERQTGLRLGGPAFSWIGKLGIALIVFPFLSALPGLAWNEWVRPLPSFTPQAMVAMFFAGVVLAKLDPGRLTGRVGDHARAAGRRNYGKLVKQGASVRDSEIWALFVDVLAVESRLKPNEITRETVFFRSQLKSA
jgi:hypothetical protein